MGKQIQSRNGEITHAADVLVLSAVRTPIGKYGGGLAAELKRSADEHTAGRRATERGQTAADVG
jgi:hypothetical protein